MTSFRVPLRFLRARDARTTLTVVAIALGVALVCALDMVTRSTELAFDEVIDGMAGRAALELSAADGGLIAEDLAVQIRDVPGVELAIPVVQATAFTTDDVPEALTVHGIDLLNEDALRAYESPDPADRPFDDPVRFLADPRGVILTRSYAARRGLHEGDAIELDTVKGRHSFSVLGLLEPRGIARVYGGDLVVMDVTAAQDVFAQRGLVHRIDVVVSGDTAVDVVRSRISARLPSSVAVTTPAQRKVDLRGVMRSFQLMLRAIGIVGLVVAYLIAFNGVSSGFERRRWQLGVLAAIGARPRAIWREQMKEALLIGIASVVPGVVLGIVLARFLLPVIATSTALNFNLIAPDARLVPSGGSIALAAVLGIGATLLAAWLPAARAVRVDIATTLRGRGTETPPDARIGWALPLVLAVGAAAATAVEVATQSPMLGLLATALVVSVVGAAAPGVVQLAAGFGLPILVRAFGSSGRLAATGVRDHPRRVGLTTATIAVGIAAVAWLLILARSFEASVVDALGRAISADLVVTSADIGSGFLEAPLADDIVARVGDVPGVDAVAGWRALEWPYAGERIGISAYDASYFRNSRFGEWPLQDAVSQDVWERVARGDGVVVSTSFVKSFGKGAGDALTLDTPTGPMVMPIVGVTIDFVSPKGTIEISRAAFSERWRDGSVTRTFVLRDPSVSEPELRGRIAAALAPRFRTRILSARELLDYFVTQVRRAFSVIPTVAGMVFLVILAGLSNSLATSVLERRRELAVVRAIGLRAGLARRVVVLESLIIGVVGLVLASAGGLLLATMWIAHTFQLLLGWSLTVRVPGGELALLAAGTLVVCHAAARAPARRAERVELAEALRSP